MLPILFIIVVGLYFLHNFIYHNAKDKEFNKIPGPKLYPLVGNAPEFIKTQVPLFYSMRKLASQFDGIYRVSFVEGNAVVLYNPNDIEILLNSQKNITKEVIYEFLHPWLNTGLLTSTGEKWHSRRKILTPAFHFNILKQFCKIFVEQSHHLAEKLKKTDGQEVNVLPFITDFTLHSISETAMGTSLDLTQSKAVEYKNAIYTMGQQLLYRITRVWLHPSFIFYRTPTGIKQKKVLKTLHEFTTDVIKERRKDRILSGDKFVVEDFTEEKAVNQKKRLAMLDLLLAAESEGKIDEVGIREEVDTFMFEGHDTITMAITFCLMLLANNPDVQQLAYEEVKEVLQESKSISMDDLNNMKYLERCIKESLRLYPSVPFFGRKITDDLQLTKHVLPVGTSCEVHVYDMHRDPKLYPNPEKYDPDRFLPENCAKRHPFAYLPFSAGPRNCIGQKYAILEAKVVLSTVLNNFKLLPVTKPNDVVFSLDIILRPSKPVRVKFIPRNISN